MKLKFPSPTFYFLFKKYFQNILNFKAPVTQDVIKFYLDQVSEQIEDMSDTWFYKSVLFTCLHESVCWIFFGGGVNIFGDFQGQGPPTATSTRQVYNLFQDLWNWFIILKGGKRVQASRQTDSGWVQSTFGAKAEQITNRAHSTQFMQISIFTMTDT